MPHRDQIKELLEKIYKAYKKARKEKIISPRIYRGRAHSIAPAFEVEVAKLLSNWLQQACFLVDAPITFKDKNTGKNKRKYPDICIIENDKIIGIVETKLDLGFPNEKWHEKFKSTVTYIASHPSCSANFKGEKKTLICPRHIASCAIVASRANDHGRWRDLQNVPNVFCLIREGHLNSPKYTEDMLAKEPQRNRQEWDNMYSFIANNFTSIKA